MGQLRLRGIYPPTVTPLNNDETIDEAGLRRLLDHLIVGGVHGFYLLGSTGEFAALRSSERRKAMEIAVDEVRGRVPIVAGASAESTVRAVDNIGIAQECGVDAVAITPTYYYPTGGAAEQIAHYKACVRSTDLPLVIYNIPQMTKVMLSPDTVGKIAELDGIISIKDSSGDWTYMLNLLNRLQDDEDFSILAGAPMLAASHILMGGDGAVMGLGNLDPVTCVRLYESAKTHDLEELWRWQRRVFDFSRVATYGAPIVCYKTALMLMGICQDHACAPFQSLSADARGDLASTLRELGLVDTD